MPAIELKTQLERKKMKYEFVDDDTVTAHDGTILRRIRARIDIPRIGLRPHHVLAGDLGGYLDRFDNLDADEDNPAWVGGLARCYGNACVFERAQMWDESLAYGDAHIFGSASMSGKSMVFDMANLSQMCHAYDNAKIFGEARIGGLSRIYGNATIGGRAKVDGDAQVFGSAVIVGRVHIGGSAMIGGNTRMDGDQQVIDGDGDRHPR